MTTTYIQITRDNHTWFGKTDYSVIDGRFTYTSLQAVPELYVYKSQYYSTSLSDTITHYTTTEFPQLFPELFI